MQTDPLIDLLRMLGLALMCLLVYELFHVFRFADAIAEYPITFGVLILIGGILGWFAT